jgi:hypothetical protein
MSATDGAAAHLAVHDGEGAQPFRDRVLALWPLAFGPVADTDDWRHRFWEQHRTRAGWQVIGGLPEGKAVMGKHLVG